MTPQPPTPLSILNQPSTNLPPAKEYSLKHWLSSATTIHNQFTNDWNEAKKVNDPLLVESAYKALRKFAEILKLVMGHPDFNSLLKSNQGVSRQYHDLRNALLEASKTKAEMVNYLETRERSWESIHGPILSPSSIPSPPPPMSPLPPPLTSPATQDHHPPPPQTLPQQAPSIQARLNALRQNGLTASTTTTTTPAKLPPPIVPKKPEGLSLSPKRGALRELSPAGHSNGVVTGEKMERGRSGSTSSAPNGVEYTAQQHQQQQPKFDRTASEIETDFVTNFPSLDQLDLLPPTPTTYSAPPSPKSMATPVFPSSRGPLPLPPSHSRDPAYHSSSTFLNNGPLSPPLQQLQPQPPAPTHPQTSSSKIPFSAEVSPKDLCNFLEDSSSNEREGRPRVILLDVRNPDEWEAGRVKGESVCLDPSTLAGWDGITSKQIEQALLKTRPSAESSRFLSRNHYDVLIIYDRSSLSIPTTAPHSTSSSSQKVLWNLTQAIYEKEFEKSLKRQPVLMRGGWEGWRRECGERGAVRGQGQGVELLEDVYGDGERNQKERNRRTTVLGGTVTNGASNSPSPKPYHPSLPSTSAIANGGYTNGATAGGGYFNSNPLSSYQSSYSSSGALLSPRLALPPTAVQRPGSVGTVPPNVSGGGYESYPSSNYGIGGGRPSYPQPGIDQRHYGGSGGMAHATINEFGGLISPQQQSFSPTPLTSSASSSIPHTRIDYPSLNPRSSLPTSALPISSYAAPPPTSSPYAPSPNALTRPSPSPVTRPPAAQPAPIRSNSVHSMAGVGYVPTGTGSMRFKTNDLKFGDQAIGLTGLKNLGNTCYMNSTIQCLSATIPFARYFKEGGYKRDINRTNVHGTKGALADAVAELIRAIWAQNYLFLSPITFRENICRWAPQFKGSDQHDAQEFLGFLLDGLHEDLNYITDKPKPVEMSKEREKDLESLPQQVMSQREWDIYRRRDDSFVVQCFQGQFRNQLRCLTCQTTSTTYNTFMPLSVPIPSGRGITKCTLQECITAFVKEETLDKEDAWNCPKCKVPRKATKKLTLSRLPPILVIHLKRFSFKGPFSDKIETQVQYPLSGLDLTSYMPPPLFDPKSPPVTTAPKGYVYDLYGVTNHYGNLSSGHYTAFVRNHNSWSNIGDSKVSAVDPAAVQSAKSAYILYFALRT